MDARAPKAYAEHTHYALVDRILWAMAQRNPLTWPAIVERFGVSRSTAYRWLTVLEDARQRVQLMDIPRRSGLRTPVRDDARVIAQ